MYSNLGLSFRETLPLNKNYAYSVQCFTHDAFMYKLYPILEAKAVIKGEIKKFTSLAEASLFQTLRLLFVGNYHHRRCFFSYWCGS